MSTYDFPLTYQKTNQKFFNCSHCTWFVGFEVTQWLLIFDSHLNFQKHLKLLIQSCYIH